MKKKKNKKICCNPYEGFQLPPCAKFLNSFNPLIKDNKLIYKNNNRLYFFITLNKITNKEKRYDPLDPLSYKTNAIVNIQIEPYYFYIALFVNEVQKGNIKDYKDVNITDKKESDDFIKKILCSKYNIDMEIIPSITYLISNSSAVVPLLQGTIDISPINYYIVYILSRNFKDYGVIFSDNSYVTNDYINNLLANICIGFDTC